MKQSLLFICTAFLLQSCSVGNLFEGLGDTPSGSGNPTFPQGQSACRIKTFTVPASGGGNVYQVTYNYFEMITDMVSSLKKVKYVYNNTGLASIEYYNTGNLQAYHRRDLSYDASGYLSEEKNYDYTAGAWQYIDRTVYTYAGFKVVQKDKYAAGTTYTGKQTFDYTGENITTQKVYDAAGVLTATYNYSYNLARTNSFYNNFSQMTQVEPFPDDITTMPFYSARNEPVHIDAIIPGAPATTPAQNNFTYTYNSSGMSNTVNYNGAFYRGFTHTCD